MEYGKSFLFSINGNPDIFVLKLNRHGKLFPECIKDPVTSDKPYKMDISRKDSKPGRNLKVPGKILQVTSHLFQRGLSLQGAVSVIFVMKDLKPFCLGYNMIKTFKVLGPKKHLVKYILEFLYDAVSPGLSYGDKDGLNAKIKAKPDYKAE